MVLNPSFFFVYHDRCANWQYNALDVFDHWVLISMESFMHGATAITLAKTELLYIPQKCGGIGSNGFHIKWKIGTHGNWKNQNPGGRFGATG